MKRYLFFIITISTFLGCISCNSQMKDLSDFLPEGYIISEEVYGDLNEDGIEDCILIIKGTDKKNIRKDERQVQIDRNRRGIIILLNKKDNYSLAVKNYDCFSSENEDGGVYFPPELYVGTEKGNLFIHYGHGRYGYWKYTFRFRNSDFELIEYDASNNSGPKVNTQTSINFLTKKKLIRENVSVDDSDEVFKETWQNIDVNEPIKLSEIKDFDKLQI